MNMDTALVADVVLWVSIFIVGLLVRVYLPGYIREKSKNHATKEDIAGITKEIEQVKVEYAKQLESYKSEIWQTQQRYLQMQEEAKLRVETFKKAVVDIAKITNLIGIYQLHASNSEMSSVIADLAHEKGNEKLQKISWDMHLDTQGKAAALYTTFRELIVELGSTYALFSVYFDPALTESLNRIISMAQDAVELKMSPAEFREHVVSEHSKGHDLNEVREIIGRHYDTLYDVQSVKIESNRLFKLMRNQIKQQ